MNKEGLAALPPQDGYPHEIFLRLYCVFSGARSGSPCSLGSPAMTPMPQLVRVESTPGRAGARADQRALLASCEAADASATERRPGDRQLITMLLPKTPFVAVITMSGDSRSVCRLRRCNRLACESQR